MKNWVRNPICLWFFFLRASRSFAKPRYFRGYNVSRNYSKKNNRLHLRAKFYIVKRNVQTRIKTGFRTPESLLIYGVESFISNLRVVAILIEDKRLIFLYKRWHIPDSIWLRVIFQPNHFRRSGRWGLIEKTWFGLFRRQWRLGGFLVKIVL